MTFSQALPVRNADLPNLGVGLGFREPLRSDLFLNRDNVDFLEIIADHYMAPTLFKERELDLLAAHFPLVPHGLNLSLGSAEGLDAGYLDALADVVNRVHPPWWSEHIALTRAGGIEIGHLSPLPFTREAVDVVCRNVESAQKKIHVPLILENITWNVRLPGRTMDEAEFVTAILEKSGCGLLLDVTNLYTNACNHGDDPIQFLEGLPLDRIVQLHFVGGHWFDGEWIDSHSQPTPPAVWDLLDQVLRRAPVKGVILERDENLPPFAELAGELQHARALGRQYQQWA